jgi:hypothetical protein
LLSNNGPWTYLNTIVAGVVLVIIVAYSFPQSSEHPLTNLQRFAVSLAIGLTFSIAVSWPVEWTGADVNAATGIGLGLGGLAAVLCFWRMLEKKDKENWKRQ